MPLVARLACAADHATPRDRFCVRQYWRKLARVPGSRYRLIVFDWDGTLLDSIAMIVGCTQATLAELDLPRADEAGIRSAIGLGIHEMVQSFCPGCSAATFDRIVVVYRRLWFERFANEPRVFEGVRNLLAGLVDEGRLLAIATAKSRRGLSGDLERTGLNRFFRASRSADDAAGKPNPEMLFGLLEELGVCAEDALMVGDAVHDLEMANNAGVAAVGVASGTTAREVLLESGALVCLDAVEDLRGWLERGARLPARAARQERAR